MFITEDAIQFNLDHESDHEKEMMKALSAFKGDVTITQGADIGMCSGDYIRSFGDRPTACAITIRKPQSPKACEEK